MSDPEIQRLECWVTLNGETGCIECGGGRIGSRPVALLPPRTCAFCEKEIQDKWPTLGFETWTYPLVYFDSRPPFKSGTVFHTVHTRVDRAP